MNGPASATIQHRVRLPAFITELYEDPVALRTLVGACAAIAAVGLEPHIFDPGMPQVRAAIKVHAELRNVLMVGAVVQAGLLLLCTALLAEVLLFRRTP